MNLEKAVLTYGTRQYPVAPTETTPLPVEFDFNNPHECAQRVFAIMSNASGGHVLRDCTLRINRRRKTANLTANGCHVFYAPPDRPKLTVQEVERVFAETEVISLGHVRTDQYGEGYNRAYWTPVV